MRRLRLVNSLRLALVAAVGLTLVACEDSRYRGSQRHWVPLSGEMYALMSEKGVRKDDPILIRSFKKESELEVWKRGRDGRYVHLKTYPMCRWSGQLGPKKREGDRQAPEGFYSINQGQLNPNSSYYLSYNMGYPNAYDRAHGRSGSLLMVHGACSSAGCYSMTDDQIGEIYALSREALNGGQKSIQMQALPFRMTAENLAKLRLDQNMPFWKNLKEGADLFEVTKQEPTVSVCRGRYMFGTESATGGEADCAVKTDPVVQAEVQTKRSKDDSQIASLVSKGTPAVRLVYNDGDQHNSFKEILARAGADGLNAKASWASRDVGVSRSDGLVSGPRVVVLDNAGKTRGTVQASSSDTDAILAAAREIDTQKVAEAKVAQAKPAETKAAEMKTAEAKPAEAKPAAASAPLAKPAATATAVVDKKKIAPGQPVAADTTAAASKQESPGAVQSVFQKVMSFNPFAKASSEETTEQKPVESVVPAAPQRTKAPVPPRRAEANGPTQAAIQ